MNESGQLAKPMGISELISKAWQMWKEKVLVLVKIQLLLIVPFIIIAVVIGVGGAASLVFLKSFLENNSTVGMIIFGLLILLGIILLVIFSIMAMWPQVAMFKVIMGEKIGTIEAYRQGWSKIFSFWWTSLFAGLIIGLGILCLIIPGIILAVWYSFIFYILIEENLSGWAAMTQSKNYVSGFWWDVFVKTLVLIALSIGISLVFGLIAIPVDLLLGLAVKDAAIREIFSQFIQNAFSLLMTPFSLIYYYLIFKDLKSIKQVNPVAPVVS